MNINLSQLCDLEFDYPRRTRPFSICDVYLIDGFRKDENRGLNDAELDFLNNEKNDWVQDQFQDKNPALRD